MFVSSDAFYTGIQPALNSCWEEILCLADKLDYPQGHHLVLNNTSYFYYIKSGSLSLIQSMENGKNRIISPIQEPGTLINIAHSLAKQITDFIEKGCYFYCITDVTLYRFDGSLLYNPDFICKHTHLISNLMASLGVKLLAHHTLLTCFGTGTAKQQICRFFYNISESFNGATELNPNISQTDLANLLGINRATLVRILQELKNNNIIIEFTKSRLVIGDKKKLSDIASN